MSRVLAVLIVTIGCSPEVPHEHASDTPFVVDVIEFTPGPGAGFGQDALPDVVLGAPRAGGEGAGSTDVVSLGVGGSIVVELGVEIVDGEGIDFIVFENPFAIAGTESVFVEPAEVAVSADGESFVSFECMPASEPVIDGCAGYE